MLSFDLVEYFLWLAQTIVLVRVVLSWLVAYNVVNNSSDIVRGLSNITFQLTEPLLAPLRRIIPMLGPIDLSPLVLLMIINLLRSIVVPDLFLPLMHYS